MSVRSTSITPSDAAHVAADPRRWLHLSPRITETSERTAFTLPNPGRNKGAPDDRSEPRHAR